MSCLVRHFPSHSVAVGFRLYEHWLNSLVTHDEIKRERFIESPVAHPSVMVRREVLTEIGGWRDPGWAEDYDLWLRCFAAGVIFEKIDRPLFFWREHDDRLTRTDTRYSVPSFLRCKAHFLARGPLASFSKVILWGAGQTGRRMSKFLARGGRRDRRSRGHRPKEDRRYAARDRGDLAGGSPGAPWRRHRRSRGGGVTGSEGSHQGTPDRTRPRRRNDLLVRGVAHAGEPLRPRRRYRRTAAPAPQGAVTAPPVSEMSSRTQRCWSLRQ